MGGHHGAAVKRQQTCRACGQRRVPKPSRTHPGRAACPTCGTLHPKR